MKSDSKRFRLDHTGGNGWVIHDDKMQQCMMILGPEPMVRRVFAAAVASCGGFLKQSVPEMEE